MGSPPAVNGDCGGERRAEPCAGRGAGGRRAGAEGVDLLPVDRHGLLAGIERGRQLGMRKADELRSVVLVGWVEMRRRAAWNGREGGAGPLRDQVPGRLRVGRRRRWRWREQRPSAQGAERGGPPALGERAASAQAEAVALGGADRQQHEPHIGHAARHGMSRIT